MQAELVELDNEGQPVPSLTSYQLTLNKLRDRLMSFTLLQITGSKCPPGALCILPYFEIKREFRIIKQADVGCGSRKIFAINVDREYPSRLTVLDHTTRLCDDFHPYTWVVTVQEGKHRRKNLGGNPSPTDQDEANCAEIGQNTICTMEYAPTTCTAYTLHGERLNEAIGAHGGNPCLASMNVKIAACEKGLEWWRLRDDEIFCPIAIEPPCPLFSCAAPPPGCRYVPDGALNDHGCPVSCGTVVCDDPVSIQ